MKNRNNPINNHWRTPPELYEKWNKLYGFDFDPCPWHHDLSKWDGLDIDWGDRNFVNPPYSLTEKTAFVQKAYYMAAVHGRFSFCLLPVSTSTGLFQQLIKPFAYRYDFEESRIPFIGINSKGQYVNYHLIQQTSKETITYREPSSGTMKELPKYIKNSGQFDSMTVIFR